MASPKTKICHIADHNLAIFFDSQGFLTYSIERHSPKLFFRIVRRNKVVKIDIFKGQIGERYQFVAKFHTRHYKLPDETLVINRVCGYDYSKFLQFLRKYRKYWPKSEVKIIVRTTEGVQEWQY